MAKNQATEITNYNVVRKNSHGESPITTEHVQNNSDIRDLLLRRGITPEKMLPEEDVKKWSKEYDHRKNGWKNMHQDYEKGGVSRNKISRNL